MVHMLRPKKYSTHVCAHPNLDGIVTLIGHVSNQRTLMWKAWSNLISKCVRWAFAIWLYRLCRMGKGYWTQWCANIHNMDKRCRWQVGWVYYRVPSTLSSTPSLFSKSNACIPLEVCPNQHGTENPWKTAAHEHKYVVQCGKSYNKRECPAYTYTFPHCCSLVSLYIGHRLTRCAGVLKIV